MNAPLVLLHGFLGSPSDYALVVKSVVEVSGPRETTCLSLSGHSATTPSATSASCADISFTAEIDRLALLIAKRHNSPVHVAGYSMGGRVALGLAIQHAGLVSRLTLVSSRRGLDSETERVRRRKTDDTWAKLLEQGGLSSFLPRWWDQPLFLSLKGLPKSTLEVEIARRRSLDPVGLAWALRHLGLGCQPSYADEVRQLTVPTTLVVGGLDEKFRLLAAELVEQLPNARAVVVKGHGHSLLLEAPEAVGRAIAEEPLS